MQNLKTAKICSKTDRSHLVEYIQIDNFDRSKMYYLSCILGVIEEFFFDSVFFDVLREKLSKSKAKKGLEKSENLQMPNLNKLSTIIFNRSII